MKREILSVFAVVLGLTLTSLTLNAHHSFAAQYDVNKPVTIEGTVTKVEWMNPHVYFYLDVETEGRVVNYGVENGAPTRLFRQGWQPDTLKAGDIVTVDGTLARNGSPLVNASTVTMNGRRLFAGSSNPDEQGN